MNFRANDVINALEAVFGAGLQHNNFTLLFMRVSSQSIELMQDGTDILHKPPYQHYINPLIEMFSSALNLNITNCNWLKLKIAFDPDTVHIERGEYLIPVVANFSMRDQAEAAWNRDLIRED